MQPYVLAESLGSGFRHMSKTPKKDATYLGKMHKYFEAFTKNAQTHLVRVSHGSLRTHSRFGCLGAETLFLLLIRFLSLNLY